MLAGRFRFDKENALGKFYVGELPSVYWAFGEHLVLHRGGFWLPVDSSQHPRVFYYSSEKYLHAKTVSDLEKLRTGPAATGALGGNSSIAATVGAVPSGISPLRAGVAVGLAVAIVDTLAKPGQDEPVLPPPPKDSEFATALRRVLVDDNRRP